MPGSLSLPITTSRTRIRMMSDGDLDTLVAYRNDPLVARYQDWPLPWTRERATSLLAEHAGLMAPRPGVGMVQLAIDHDGRMVGDVGLELRFDGETAALGYNLAPEWHGCGLAQEAVGAVVDALFAAGTRRIVASTDPENLASIRVLDLLGFRCEGLALEAEPIRGEWLDDLRFGLLAQHRAEWLARPRSFATFELAELTNEHARAVARLETHRHQVRLVSPIGKTLAEAIAPPSWEGHLMRPWHRVVLADGEVAGFVMVALPIPSQPAPYLWRLLIDRRHQSRGLGAATVGALAEHFRNDGNDVLMVSFVPGLGSPQPFYERLGFRLNGREDDGELEAELAL